MRQCNGKVSLSTALVKGLGIDDSFLEMRRHDTYFLDLLRAHSWAKFGTEPHERGPATLV